LIRLDQQPLSLFLIILYPPGKILERGEGQPLEAQLEGDGIYHGYPMPQGDPLRAGILARWRRP
jgi:hypothetical protein